MVNVGLVFLFTLAMALAGAVSAFAATDKLVVAIKPWGGSLGGIIEALVERFAEAHPEIDVQTVILKDHYGDDLKVMVLGGAAPDVAIVTYSTEMELLQPLNRYLEQSAAVQEMMAGTGPSSEIFKAALELFTVDGATYFLPSLHYYPVEGLTLNASLFEENGIEVFPEDRAVTFDEFADAHKKLTRTDSQGNVIQLGYPVWDPIDAMRADIVGIMFDIDVVDPATGLPNWMRLLDPLATAYQALVEPWGYAAVSALRTDFRGGFAGRRWAIHEGNASLAKLAREFGLTADRLQATFLPSQGGTMRAFLAGHHWGLVRGAQNIENAMKFLDWTLKDIEWQRMSFLDQGLIGPPGYDYVQDWIPADMEPAVAWFYTSLRYATLHKPMTNPWNAFMINDQWRAANGMGIQYLRGEAPIESLLEEAQRVLEAKIREDLSRG